MELRFTLKSITGTWYFVLAAKIVVVQKVTDRGNHMIDSYGGAQMSVIIKDLTPRWSLYSFEI